MGYRLYFRGRKADNTAKEDFCLGKLYGYNEESDGLMLGYIFIMNTAAYKEYRKDEPIDEYTDYEIIDLCFTARGSIDMDLFPEEFITFLDLYIHDYKSVWGKDYPIDNILEINDYLSDCISVSLEWF